MVDISQSMIARSRVGSVRLKRQLSTWKSPWRMPGAPVGRPVLLEPRRHEIEVGQVAVPVALVLASPATDLTLEEVCRAPVVGEPQALPIQ